MQRNFEGNQNWVPVTVQNTVKELVVGYILARAFVHNGGVEMEGRNFYTPMDSREETEHLQECGVDPSWQNNLSDITVDELTEHEGGDSYNDADEVMVLRASGISCNCGRAMPVARHGGVIDVIQGVMQTVATPGVDAYRY